MADLHMGRLCAGDGEVDPGFAEAELVRSRGLALACFTPVSW